MTDQLSETKIALFRAIEERDIARANAQHYRECAEGSMKVVANLRNARDRLRAALERTRDLAEDGKTSACAMQACEGIELVAQEALSHD